MLSILLILKGFGACDLLGNSLTAEQRTLTPSVLVRIQVPQPIHSQSHGLYKALSDRQRIEPWLPRIMGPSHWGAPPGDATGDAKARKNVKKSQPAVLGVTDTIFATLEMG
jgi:hypothetical protein